MSRGRFAVFPPVGSHLFVTGSRLGFRKGKGEERKADMRELGHAFKIVFKMCVMNVFFFFADVNIGVIGFLNVFFFFNDV